MLGCDADARDHRGDAPYCVPRFGVYRGLSHFGLAMGASNQLPNATPTQVIDSPQAATAHVHTHIRPDCPSCDDAAHSGKPPSRTSSARVSKLMYLHPLNRLEAPGDEHNTTNLPFPVTLRGGLADQPPHACSRVRV